MKREIKNFGKYIEVSLIILTFISLIISSLQYTNAIYDNTMKLNNFVASRPFSITLLVDNVLIILLSIFYIIDTIQQKKNILLKISFCILSICSTMIVSSLIINGVAMLFGIL